MNLGRTLWRTRLWKVAALDLRENVRRPLYLLWALFLAFNAFLISRGRWIIQSVDTSVGGEVSWFNSEFEIAYATSLMSFFLLSFLVALAAGLPIVRDERLRVGEILHATPLRPAEYVGGKFLAALASCLAVAAAYGAALFAFTEIWPDLGRPEAYGPLRWRAIVAPIAVFFVPAITFTAGAALLLGVWARRALVVFLLPIGLFLFYWNWFWGYFPESASPSAIRWMNAFDPSGFRWLKYEWLMVDRGISFYNVEPIGYDAAFLASRLGWTLAGLGCAVAAWALFARRLRAPTPKRLRSKGKRAIEQQAKTRGTIPTSDRGMLAPGLAALGMKTRPPGLARAAWSVFRFELRELLGHPGLYVLVPIVVSMVAIPIGQGFGPFATPQVVTSGSAAMRALGPLAAGTALLLLFYGVDVFRREDETRLRPIHASTPAPTTSVLLGKVAALGALVAIVLVAAFGAAAWRVLGDGGTGRLDLAPFALAWIALLGPTLLAWVGFVALVYHATRHRYATYGIGIAALVATGWLAASGEMTWRTNWAFFVAPLWSDLAPFGLDRMAIALNRSMVFCVGLLFLALVRAVVARRERDPAMPVSRRVASWPRAGKAALVALAAAVIASALALHAAIEAGHDGGRAKTEQKKYWRTHLATFRDADLPEIRRMDLEVDLLPERRQVRVEGTYRLRNAHGAPLPWIPITRGVFWDDIAWTWNGEAVEPEDIHGLVLFEPPGGLAPLEEATLGFSCVSTVRPGPSETGQPPATGEWVLPSSTVLTGRNPDFLPVVGYLADRGVEEEENGYEPARFPPGAHLGPTESETDRDVFHARLRITAPDPLRVNSMGVLVDRESLDDDRTAWTWETDYPVRVVNLVAGHWAEAKGENGTAVYYDRRHPWNVPSLLRALDAAVEHYGEWFAPYPWRELRLSEFANLGQYARGNPTNILFSEGAGFLGRFSGDDGALDVAFTIAAHEAAHQWFGHTVAHGDAPGGIVLAEGASHFATALLLEEELGDAQRRTFLRRLERDWGELRDVSNEKPLVELRFHRPADVVAIYQKGGWAFWMLLEHLGRDPFFEGMRGFFEEYHEPIDAPPGAFDHPVLQDFLAWMRPWANDPVAYDAFVETWFYGVEVPEYRLSDPVIDEAAEGFEATVTLTNLGVTRMPVTVAATPDEHDADRCAATVTVGPGESVPVELRCTFEPDGFVVDPDVEVLQLQRRAARLWL